VLGFAFSYIANILVNVILYDFCLLPAQFSDEIINVRNFESHIQFADRCAPWKISDGAENRVLQALQLQKIGVCRKFPGAAGISHY
jgi:hypothetical protein